MTTLLSILDVLFTAAIVCVLLAIGGLAVAAFCAFLDCRKDGEGM